LSVKNKIVRKTFREMKVAPRIELGRRGIAARKGGIKRGYLRNVFRITGTVTSAMSRKRPLQIVVRGGSKRDWIPKRAGAFEEYKGKGSCQWNKISGRITGRENQEGNGKQRVHFGKPARSK